MKSLKFTCKRCGPAGCMIKGGMKVCNNCGETKRLNKRQTRCAPTAEFLEWLGCQAFVCELPK